jgi:hypothetical protein
VVCNPQADRNAARRAPSAALARTPKQAYTVAVGPPKIALDEEQHVEMDFRFSAEPNRRMRLTAPVCGRLVRMPRFLDQVRGDDAVDDAQHLAQDRRPNGEQEAHMALKVAHHFYLMGA